MKEIPKPSVLIEIILKEYSEEEFRAALRILKEKYGDYPRNYGVYPSPEDYLLSFEDFSRVPNLPALNVTLLHICKMLNVTIPYIYVHYPIPKKNLEEQKKRARFKPPKINYGEEIKKIQEKYQTKIRQFCKGKSHFETCFERNKRKEFEEIINLYLARLVLPHRPINDNPKSPPYVVCSLAELRKYFIYWQFLTDEAECDYDSLINGFFRRYLKGETLDYQAVAVEILRLHSDMMYDYYGKMVP